jgi:aspartyl protease family protein
MWKPISAAILLMFLSVGSVEFLKRRAVQNKIETAQRAPEASQPRGMMVLQEDGRGHFVAATIMNGILVESVVDTGASLIALSMEDAARIGVFPNAGDFKVSLSTANGSISAAPVKLREVRLGSIRLQDIDAVVLPSGRLKGTLLGMSFLRRLSSFQVSNGALLLKE